MDPHESVFDMKALRYFVFKQLVKSKSFEKLVVISDALRKLSLKKKFLQEIKIQVAHDGADKVENLQNKVKLFVKRKL